MSDKNLQWYKIAGHISEIGFGDNNIAVTTIREKQICLARFNTEAFAFAYSCPHAAGILAEGFIDARGNVVCPVHKYRYSIRNGHNTSGEGYYLKTWPVELREDGVYLGLPANEGMDGAKGDELFGS